MCLLCLWCDIFILLLKGSSNTYVITGVTPLFVAAFKGHTDVVQLLARSGKVDVNQATLEQS